MAEIQVRFRNGDIGHWELHEAMDLRNLVKVLTRSTGATRVVSFGVVSEGGGSADYDFVGLAMAEVVSWQIKGLFDTKIGGALWAELEGPAEEPPGPSA